MLILFEQKVLCGAHLIYTNNGYFMFPEAVVKALCLFISTIAIIRGKGKESNSPPKMWLLISIRR